MAVSRLALTYFRSYAQATVSARPGLIVLTGENGVGKTNVLEALSLLSPGRGLRRASLGEMAQTPGPGGFAVAAQLADGVEIGTGTIASAPERRQVRINGAPGSANALADRIALLWLTPAMDRLFIEGAAGRRRFLDRLVLAREPAHAVHATRYEAAMRSRNRLLNGDAEADPSWLAALEAGMAEHGVALAGARKRTVDDLSTRLADAPTDLFARAGLALEGEPPPDAESFREQLRTGRRLDAAAGRTLVGPHRSDLSVTHLGKNQPAERSSTGEQKALLLGIVLAHADLVAADLGKRPVLLLDEVAAHLDPGRRAALFDRLVTAGGQVWMTGTEPALFAAAPRETQRLIVFDGALREE